MSTTARQRFNGRVALVTGAGRGIGRAIAEAFAAEGAAVAVNDVDSPAVDSLVSEISSRGGRACGYVADVRDHEATRAMVQDVHLRMGGPHVLVNNAGIIRRGTLESMSLDDWHDVIAVNMTGAFYLCKAVVGFMKQARYGKIVNVASITAKTGDIASSPSYGPSKAGLACLARSLARELAPFGINVNAVAPHAIETEMSAQWSAEKRAAILAGIPLGRLGRPEDVAAAVLFLASDEASFITGEVLDINGGAFID